MAVAERTEWHQSFFLAGATTQRYVFFSFLFTQLLYTVTVRTLRRVFGCLLYIGREPELVSVATSRPFHTDSAADPESRIVTM